MKRILLIIAAVLALSFGAYAAPDLAVYVDGELLQTEVQPVIINDRTMLPMRAVFEQLGAQVDWIEEEKIIIASKEGVFISFKIDTDVMLVQDMSAGGEKERVILDAPPTIVGESTMVPVRAVSEAFGAQVIWNAEDRAVQIVTKPADDLEDKE